MINSRNSPRDIVILAICLPCLLASAPAPAQSPGPDALLLRLNGTRALTQVVLPIAAEQSGQLNKDINHIDAGHYQLTMSGFGVVVDSWASDVELRVPIDSNDVTALFKAASQNRGRVEVTFDFDAATLKFKFHVQTHAKDPATTALSTVVQQRASLNETFAIAVSQLKGSIDLTLRQAGSGIEVEQVNSFSVQIGDVDITDSAWLTEIAGFLLGFDTLFHVTGASNVKSAATKLTNHILAADFNLQERVRNVVNIAMKAISTQQFGQQAIALPQGGLMLFNASLAGLDSEPGAAISAWNLATDAKPDNKVPGLTYSILTRPAEDPWLAPMQGDLQVFLPYTFLDQVIYELVEAGILRSIPVPDVDGSGPLRSFDMDLVPTSMPRVNLDDTNPAQVLISFGARMEDAVVGTVAPVTAGGLPTPAPSGPSSALPTDISTVSATADVRVHAQISGNSDSGIFLIVQQVDLPNLSGQLKFAMNFSSIAPFRIPLQNAINTAIKKRGGVQLMLMSRAISLMDPLKVAVSTPVPGTKYVRVPLTIVGPPRLQIIPISPRAQ